MLPKTPIVPHKQTVFIQNNTFSTKCKCVRTPPVRLFITKTGYDRCIDERKFHPSGWTMRFFSILFAWSIFTDRPNDGRKQLISARLSNMLVNPLYRTPQINRSCQIYIFPRKKRTFLCPDPAREIFYNKNELRTIYRWTKFHPSGRSSRLFSYFVCLKYLDRPQQWQKTPHINKA